MDKKEQFFRAQAEKIFKEKQEFNEAVEDILKYKIQELIMQVLQPHLNSYHILKV